MNVGSYGARGIGMWTKRAGLALVVVLAFQLPSALGKAPAGDAIVLDFVGPEAGSAQAADFKHLKIAARVTTSARRIVLHLLSGYPYQELFIRIAARLTPI